MLSIYTQTWAGEFFVARRSNFFRPKIVLYYTYIFFLLKRNPFDPPLVASGPCVAAPVALYTSEGSEAL